MGEAHGEGHMPMHLHQPSCAPHTTLQLQAQHTRSGGEQGVLQGALAHPALCSDLQSEENQRCNKQLSRRSGIIKEDHRFRVLGLIPHLR